MIWASLDLCRSEALSESLRACLSSSEIVSVICNCPRVWRPCGDPGGVCWLFARDPLGDRAEFVGQAEGLRFSESDAVPLRSREDDLGLRLTVEDLKPDRRIVRFTSVLTYRVGTHVSDPSVGGVYDVGGEQDQPEVECFDLSDRSALRSL